MLVVSCGLMRSGSTWQFNALRLMLSPRGFTSQFGTQDVRPHLQQGLNILVKIHTFDEWLATNADFIFTSYRDLRDACASLERFHPNRNPSSLCKMTEEFANYQRWCEVADYEMQYEQMLQDPHREIKTMANLMGLKNINAHNIATQINELELPSRGQRADRTTLLWPQHITLGVPNTFRQTLSQESIETLESQFGWWLADKGYHVPRHPE